MTRARRRGDEAGSALVELTWLGLLLLVPMLWIVLSVFEVQRGAFGVSSAARSAGRAYTLAPNDAVGQARAEAAVRLALDDQGLEGQPFTLRVTCTSSPCGLPQRDVGGHRAGVHEGPGPTASGGPRRRRTERRARRHAHGADRPVPGGRPCLAVSRARRARPGHRADHRAGDVPRDDGRAGGGRDRGVPAAPGPGHARRRGRARGVRTSVRPAGTSTRAVSPRTVSSSPRPRSGSRSVTTCAVSARTPDSRDCPTGFASIPRRRAWRSRSARRWTCR